MLERARTLVGHRLRVYRVNEQMAGNAKTQVRTVVHLTDHGPDTDPVPGTGAKENVLAAAEGDGGRQGGRPPGVVGGRPPETGSVSAHRLADALARLPAADASWP